MVQDQVYPVLYHLEVSTLVRLEVHPLRVNMVLHLEVYTVVPLAADYLGRPRVQEVLFPVI